MAKKNKKASPSPPQIHPSGPNAVPGGTLLGRGFWSAYLLVALGILATGKKEEVAAPLRVRAGAVPENVML